MTLAEITLFIAKSLSISLNCKNLEEIEESLKSQKINWDLFVKISTSQLVLLTLYCNYKRNNLLQFLPDDLVAYMLEITSLNRDRNQQIIEQINELNSLLRQNGVNPIFIKGAGYLIQGLYDDSAERMVGDIDFLVSKNQYNLAVKILKENNYNQVSGLEYPFPQFRHYPRLLNDDYIAAVEIHKDIIIEKYTSEFNYKVIKNNIIQNNGFFVLSIDDQKALCIFSNQINDYGFDYKTIGLKNAYDFLLLNSKEPGFDFVSRFNKLKTPILCFLASANYMFGDIIINVHQDRKVKKYLNQFKSLLHSPRKRKIYSRIIGIKLFLAKRLKVISKSFVNKEHRVWLFKRISDRRWQREKLVQLKLKKPINN